MTPLEFPYITDDGKMTVNTLFQSSVDNPDCNNETGEDIATLEIVNTSDSYLREAKVNVTLTDGTAYAFTATDLPAGTKAWIFAEDNASVTIDAACKKISCQNEYIEQEWLDGISAECSDTQILLTNNTDSVARNVLVGCHCMIADTSFGGVTYEYYVDEIPAHGSVTIEASDCYLGNAEVVYLQTKE